MSTAYLACLNSHAWFEHPAAPLILASGPDRIEFFQRQTTNDLTRLGRESPVVSVLADASGRILDVLEFIDLEEQEIGIRANCSLPEERLQYFRSRVFFKDRIELGLTSVSFRVIDIEGPKALAVLERLGLRMASGPGPGSGLRLPDGMPGLNGYLKPGIAAPLGARILGPQGLMEDVVEMLAELCPQLSGQEWQALRIESIRPTAPFELNSAYTPLEIHLDWAVADGKGCYTGQEVLARQRTYDKVARTLTAVQCNLPIPVGASLQKEERPVGVVTSVTQSPDFGFIGLAILRKPHDAPGTRLGIRNDPEAEVIVSRLRARGESDARP